MAESKKAKTTSKIKLDSKVTKATLYIEADEEITAVIDRVISTNEKVVAVVLPKHASVFQSVVNMKLLKRTASEAKKTLVLITSEPSIVPIAGLASIHVAKSLSSKPEIPKTTPSKFSETIITTDDVEVTDSQTEQPSTSIDEVAQSSDDEETIELDNTKSADSESETDVVDNKSAGKKLKFKIPDFSSFRIKMTLSILALFMVILGWFLGFVILPAATIIINTDTSRIDVNSEFRAKDGLESSDIENGIIAAKKVSVQKENSVTVPATGEKNIGEKATGKVTMTAQNCSTTSTPADVPAGATVTSSGVSFITDESVSFTFASFTPPCLNFSGETVDMVAVNQGTSSNIGKDKSATVSGRPDVSAIAQASGGTDNNVKVVSVEDIKQAKDQLKGSSTADALKELRSALNIEQLQPLDETIQELDTKDTQSASEGSEVAEITVKRTVTYTMLGVSSDDLSKLLEVKAQEALTDKTQNIRSNGIDSAVYQLVEKVSDAEYKLSMRSVATIGPEFDETAIKKEVTGKELGEVRQLLEPKKGVTSVNVEFSPFWIFQVPSNLDKITIVINETR